MSHTLPIQSPFSSMPDIPERIARLGVSSLECSIQQTPTAANGNVAVAQTTLAGNGLTVSMPGFATSETTNSDKPHLLLNAALMASADNAMHAFEHKQGPHSLVGRDTRLLPNIVLRPLRSSAPSKTSSSMRSPARPVAIPKR